MAQAGSLSVEIENLSHVLSLVEAFRAFDADNDGTITAAELEGILGSLGQNLSEQDVNMMMEEGDADKDGLLSIEEFLEMNTRNMELGGLGNILKSAFETLNVDGDDDLVSGEQLFDGFVDLGIEISLKDSVSIVAAMDGDGDGAVSFEDFKLIVNSLY